MKAKFLLIMLLITTITYSQEYRYGIVKDIVIFQGRIEISIDEVDVSYDNKQQLKIVNNSKKVVRLILDSKTIIKDCLFNRIHHSNIMTFKSRLINDQQFLIYKSRGDLLKELNINCYN